MLYRHYEKEMKPWEIWLAFSSDEGKDRPVLILEVHTMHVIAFEITSHNSRNLYGEYEIIQWQTARLSKPSTIRTMTRMEIWKSAVHHKIGELQETDIKLLKKYL